MQSNSLLLALSALAAAAPAAVDARAPKCALTDVYCIETALGYAPAAASYYLTIDNPLTKPSVLAALLTASVPASVADEFDAIVTSAGLGPALDSAVIENLSYLPTNIASQLAAVITPGLALQTAAPGASSGAASGSSKSDSSAPKSSAPANGSPEPTTSGASQSASAAGAQSTASGSASSGVSKAAGAAGARPTDFPLIAMAGVVAGAAGLVMGL